ncbi:MAG: hypothetical protein HOV81_22105 [Kofleriaceae bacterium]|nr:hypothetical protein [Kofleriaceae bacterium]
MAASCPDDDELAGFLDHALSAERTRALEEHFDACALCRQLAFMLAGIDPRLETGDP